MLTTCQVNLDLFYAKKSGKNAYSTFWFLFVQWFLRCFNIQLNAIKNFLKINSIYLHMLGLKYSYLK